jgi:hypothetical protein
VSIPQGQISSRAFEHRVGPGVWRKTSCGWLVGGWMGQVWIMKSGEFRTFQFYLIKTARECQKGFDLFMAAN